MSNQPTPPPAWGRPGMIPTLNGTGFMFEVRDSFTNDFISYAGQAALPVLELGCAYGVASIPALEAGARVTASDMEPRHLEILKSKVPEHLLGNLELVTATLPQAEFPPGRFAAILCSRVLHFLTGDDIDTSVQKMAQWLAPGGRLYLIADTPYGIWRKKIAEFEAGKEAGMRWPGMMVGLYNYLGAKPPAEPMQAPPFMNVLDPELLARTCTEAGLEVIEAAFIPRPDFAGAGHMDGRENAGVLAVKRG
ncbi:MAG: class I SAM-dependent methyltransferase [Gammaproteobacteria bacterium]